MPKEYGGRISIGALIKLFKRDLGTKQNNITGEPGELIMIGENGTVETTAALSDLLDVLKQI